MQIGKDHWNWGKHLSKETKEKIRRTKACVYFTPLHKKHLREARYRYLKKQRRKHGKDRKCVY